MTDKITILLVEDETNHAELIFRAFKLLWGKMDIPHVETISEAKKYLDHNKPDIIITDFLLPDGQGTMLLPQHGEQVEIPIILMTSAGDEKLAAEAIKQGAVDYVIKSPASFADMPRVVGRALRQWGLIIGRRNMETKMIKMKTAYDKLPEVLRKYTDNNTAKNIMREITT